MYTPETNSRPSLKLRGHRGASVQTQQALEPEEDDVFVFGRTPKKKQLPPNQVTNQVTLSLKLTLQSDAKFVFRLSTWVSSATAGVPLGRPRQLVTHRVRAPTFHARRRA